MCIYRLTILYIHITGENCHGTRMNMPMILFSRILHNTYKSHKQLSIYFKHEIGVKMYFLLVDFKDVSIDIPETL